MKVAQACEYLGGISPKTLYGAVKAGKCKAARIGQGRNLLFCATWLDEYAASCAVAMDDGRASAKRNDVSAPAWPG